MSAAQPERGDPRCSIYPGTAVLILAGQLAQTASVLTKSLRGLLASVDAIGNSAVRTYDSRLPAAGFGCGRDFRQAQAFI